MARLTSELILSLKDLVTGPARRVEGSLNRLDRRAQMRSMGIQRSAVAMNKMGMGIAGYARNAAAFAAPLAATLGAKEVVTQAADFESALTGIQKKAGTTAAETAKIGAEIKDLATDGSLAVGIDEITAAYERGAAAGIPTDKLREFASLSAKAADAFEMSSEAVGNSAAGFATNLDIPINEMERYFDLINGLADAGIADESDIVNFLDRSGVQLQQFGQSNEQAAALGATLLNLKMPAEVAARAMNTLTTKLLTPKSTKKSTKAFDALYGNADKFTELMKEDANEALLDFLDKINKLDKFKRAELLTDIVGQGFSDEVSRLAAGMDEYRRNLRYAADETKWFGSLDKSYQLKLDDFWSQWQLVKNSLSELAIDTGSMGMPALKDALGGVKTLIGDIQSGMSKFEATLDVKGLSDAQTAIGNLMGEISRLMGMSGEGSQIERFFGRLATAVNTVSAGVGVARDVMQAVGLAEQDEDTNADRTKRRNTLVDGFAEFNPIVGPAVQGVYDATTGRRTEAQEKQLREDIARRRAMAAAVAGKTPEQLAEERNDYWRRKNARMGPGNSVAPDAGTMRLPDITFPTEVPPAFRRGKVDPSVRPSTANPESPTARTDIPYPTPRPIEIPVTPKITDDGRAAIEAQIREIDQRLGALSNAASQVRGGFDAGAKSGAASNMAAVADEMERLMQERDALDAKLSQPMTSVAPDINGPLTIEGERAKATAQATGTAIQSSLSVTARPIVDTSEIRAAMNDVDALSAKLRAIPGQVSAARTASANAVSKNVSREMSEQVGLRHAFSDNF